MKQGWFRHILVRMADTFKLVSDFIPTGDQPEAIKKLTAGIRKGEKHQTLLGATGTGKTYVIAQLVEKLQRPTLVIAHNKTLAAQLCSEFREFFPDNAVSYFVSYYDYYQPEAYMPATDTYIEKDAQINQEIDKLRHAATANLLTRRDTLIVASVSCIYGLGSKESYARNILELKKGESYIQHDLLRKLTDMQYKRSHMEFRQSMFHVLGDTIEIFPPGGDNVYRCEFFGDSLEKLTEVDSFTGEVYAELDRVHLFPAKHDVTLAETIEGVVPQIRDELEQRYQQLKKMGKTLEAERLKTRTEYDIEMMLETGYCTGIENYTRYLSDLLPGQAPSTLIDYFPDDFLLFVDESHISIPQIGGMHNGNYSRKQTLVEHGFRLPSSYDNRPLRFTEFEDRVNQVVYVSATPAAYEFSKSGKHVAQQIIRPTGLVDPEVSVRPTKGQIQDILAEIGRRTKTGERTLITTLTKRSSEDLTEFLREQGIRVRYLHSEIDTFERIEILRDFRLGIFDVLVGINLLREGLDLPEVSFIAILDADKQGFLRSTTALIQTIGRAARNVHGFVVMYADGMTDAMKSAIGETERRRAIQTAHNKKHGITPKTIEKAVKDIQMHKKEEAEKYAKRWEKRAGKVPQGEIKRFINELEVEMDLAAQNLEFEKAAELRDEVEMLKEKYGL